jgi:hypothetical protein
MDKLATIWINYKKSAYLVSAIDKTFLNTPTLSVSVIKHFPFARSYAAK